MLRAMQRTYTREEYLEKIAMIRAARRPISVTSDIIVGFPGETEQDFEETLSLLDAAQYDGVFAFQYSPRPNTTSQHMPDAIPEARKGTQAGSCCRTVSAKFRLCAMMRWSARHLKCWWTARRGAPGQWSGRSSSNRILNFTSPRADLLGQYVQVRVTGASSEQPGR